MRSSIRTLAVLHPTFESWGGAEWYIHGILERLVADTGVEATVFTHRWRDPWGVEPPYRVREHKLGGEWSSPADWQRIARAIRPELSGSDLAMIHNYPATQWYAGAAAEGAVPPAVWYCHEPPQVLYGQQAGGAAGAAAAARSWSDLWDDVAFYRHRAIGRVFRRFGRRAGRSPAAPAAPEREEWRKRDRAAVRTIGAVAANSRFTADRVRSLYGRSANVVYPVTPELDRLAEAGPADKELAILWVGRLTDAKRPLVMLDAWGAARAARPELADWTLRMVGDGPRRGEVEEISSDPALAGSVVLERSLPREALTERYRAAHLTVHLGLAEPLGLVPLESMACSTAAVAHADGGVRETVVDGVTGRLIEDLDAEKLARVLARLPDERDEWRAMGRAAREHVRREFGFARWYDELLKVLDSAVAAV